MTFSRTLAVLMPLLGVFVASHAMADEPFILGIGTHLMNFEASPRRPLELARDAGISALKDDAFWSTAAPKPDQLRIVPPTLT